MSISMTNYELDKLHEMNDYTGKSTLVVSMAQGRLRRGLEGTIDTKREVQFYSIQNSLFIGNLIHLKKRLLSRSDEIEVDFIHRLPNEDSYKGFEENNNISRDILLRRAQYIAGFSIASYFKDSSVNLFRGPFNQWDIRLGFTHDELIAEIDDNLILSGNFDRDVVTLFNYFWYKFPVDLTGYDTEIISASMEQELIMGN